MNSMKINISEKDGRTYKTELSGDKAAALFGKKIAEEIEGDLIGAAGYVFIIKGGSDNSGFPMRADVPGSGKKSVLLSGGTGIRKATHGARVRKTVRGNVVSDEISQLNLTVKSEGATKLAELFPPTPKAGDEKKEAPKANAAQKKK